MENRIVNEKERTTFVLEKWWVVNFEDEIFLRGENITPALSHTYLWHMSRILCIIDSDLI